MLKYFHRDCQSTLVLSMLKTNYLYCDEGVNYSSITLIFFPSHWALHWEPGFNTKFAMNEIILNWWIYKEYADQDKTVKGRKKFHFARPCKNLRFPNLNLIFKKRKTPYYPNSSLVGLSNWMEVTKNPSLWKAVSCCQFKK